MINIMKQSIIEFPPSSKFNVAKFLADAVVVAVHNGYFSFLLPITISSCQMFIKLIFYIISKY